MELNKKILVIALCIIAAVAIFSMKGDKKTETDAAKDTAQTTATSSPQLIIGVDPDYESFDPGRAYEAYAHIVINGAYNNLVHFQGNLDEIKPDLAETFEATPDAKTFTFHLKKDVKFASGNPITAADVVWSINRLKNLQENPAFLAKGIESITAPDDNTVVITLSEPDGAFLAKLTYSGFAVIDSKLATENGASDSANAKSDDSSKLWFDSHSAGSGPYAIESYTPKEQVVLKRNDNYWGTPAAFDKVIIKNIKDPGTQLMMLEKGDIDIAFNLGPENVKQLEGKEGITVMKAQSMTISFLAFNRDKSVGGPMANPDVARAVRCALDYKGLQAIAGAGCTTPASIIQVGYMGALPAVDVETAQNIEKSKELMKKAGYEKGFKTIMNVPSIAVEGTDLTTLAQKVQQDLKAIGIDIEIKPSDVTQAFGVYREGKSPFGLFYWGPDYPDPNNQLAFTPKGTVGSKRLRWTPEEAPEVVELVDKALVEVDAAKRTEYIQKIQEKMVDDSPIVTLLQFGRQYAVRSNVQGAEYIDPYKLDLRVISKK